MAAMSGNSTKRPSSIALSASSTASSVSSSSGPADNIESKICEQFGCSLEAIPPLLVQLQGANQRFLDAMHKAELEMRELNEKKRVVCVNCGNDQEQKFDDDERHGQLTCRECGVVARSSVVHDGEWTRQFEGDVNPSFHGPPPNDKYSSAFNLRTGFAPAENQSKRLARDLQLTQAKIDIGESEGNALKEKRTRQGYKDERKADAEEMIKEVGSKLQLHDRVVRRAATLYSHFRQETERQVKDKAVMAAATIMALRELAARDLGKRVRVGQEAVSEEDVRPFLCPKCNLRFNSKKDLTWVRSSPGRSDPPPHTPASALRQHSCEA